MAKKVTVLINGREIQMSERAVPMAERFFGAVVLKSIPIDKPFELSPLVQPPKLLIKEPEIKKPELIKPAPVKAEAKVDPHVEKVIPPEVNETISEVKKRKSPARSKAKKK